MSLDFPTDARYPFWSNGIKSVITNPLVDDARPHRYLNLGNRLIPPLKYQTKVSCVAVSIECKSLPYVKPTRLIQSKCKRFLFARGQVDFHIAASITLTSLQAVRRRQQRSV